jgi:Uma2 family endonuclease
MTVLEGRIEMADVDANTKRLDEWFERLERMPVPEGFRVEIVGGNVHMTPQRDTHWEIIRRIVRAIEDRFGMDVQGFSGVRIDFPGHENGFCPDVAKLSDSAEKDDEGRWRYQDVEFIAEVISEGTAANDYAPRKPRTRSLRSPSTSSWNPYQGRCRVYTHPKGDDHAIDTKVDFGSDVDLTDTPLGLTLKTDAFPRD